MTISAALDPAGHLIDVVVADMGLGIAPELVDHLFDRFAKSADSRGSGLGLAIARHLVETHDGTISAASGPSAEPDVGLDMGSGPGGLPGTVIRFSLPIEA